MTENIQLRILKLLGIIAEELKRDTLEYEVSTSLQEQIYSELDGTKTASEIAEKVDTTRVRVAQLLPRWEKIGLVITEGKGPHKRYMNFHSVGEELNIDETGD
jgi:CRP-like cAMP-binding protein